MCKVLQEENAKLEITCQPEDITFRDEGGRLNYLFCYFIIRCNSNGIPKAFQDKKEIGIKCELQYEDGTIVPQRAGSASLKLFGNAGLDKPKVGSPTCNCKSLTGSVRYKILKLSRNHDSKKFRIKISLENISENIVKPAFTDPTLVLSKRKWLRADERSPENVARKQVEEEGEKFNMKIAKEILRETIKVRYDVSIRQLLALEKLEKKYPVPARLNDCNTVSSEDDSEDTPQYSINSTLSAKSYSAGKKWDRKPSMFEKVLKELGQLQNEIAQYNKTVLATNEKVQRLEQENLSLKRQLEAVEGTLALQGALKRKTSIVQFSPALDFVRNHSLVGPEDQRSFLDDIAEDAANAFHREALTSTANFLLRQSSSTTTTL